VPTGNIEKVEAVFKGVGFSSDGGYWFIRIPEFAKIGFGKKYVKFLFIFRGRIIVENDRFFNDFKKNYKDYFSLWGLDIKDFYGMRLDFNKNIILIGDILPVKKKHIELFLSKHFKSLEFDNEDFCQGHLKIFHLDRQKVEDFLERIKKVDLIDIPYQRFVFNHEIHGDYDLYYLGEQEGERIFLLDLKDENNSVAIVSSDHIESPIRLYYSRYWILKHPIPRNGNID